MVVAVYSAAVVPGCRTSPWESSLIAGPDAAMPLPEGASVRVREVPWQRLGNTIEELRAQTAASDTHPDEWPQSRKDEHKAMLLKGLQISEPAEQVKIVGRTGFSTTDQRIGPGSPALVALAARLGADTVVWSSRSLGKTDTVVQEPVTHHTAGTVRDHRGRPGSSSYAETYTYWVPIRVQADETGFVAFFLKTRP